MAWILWGKVPIYLQLRVMMKEKPLKNFNLEFSEWNYLTSGKPSLHVEKFPLNCKMEL